MKRKPVVMWVWYRGGAFHGFQNLPSERTVQGELRSALTRLGYEGIPVPAGRTDRCVHARMQVVSFRLPGDTDLSRFQEAMNVELGRTRAEELASPAEELASPAEDLRWTRAAVSVSPTADLGVAAIRWAPPSFHAQWSARGKEYRYRLSLTGTVASPWLGCAWNVREDRAFTDCPEALARLNEHELRARLADLPGTRKFLPFHAKSSVEKPRELWSVELRPVVGGPDGLLEIVFRGSAFGRYMIRYLVGGAVATSCGLISLETWRAALDQDVAFEGLRAPGSGLVLWEVLYPEDRIPFSGATPALPDGPPFTG